MVEVGGGEGGGGGRGMITATSTSPTWRKFGLGGESLLLWNRQGQCCGCWQEGKRTWEAGMATRLEAISPGLRLAVEEEGVGMTDSV